MKKALLTIGISLALVASPLIVLADNPGTGPYDAPSGLFSGSNSFLGIVNTIVSLINLIIGVLSALAIVVFFIGLVRYIRESSDAHGHGEAKERIVWSLVAIFVLFSVWGILALMSTAFFSS